MMKLPPINHLVTWRSNFVIVIADEKGIGIRFFDDTKEDEDCLITPHCQTCNKELTGSNAKYCCRSCANVGVIKSRWSNHR